jgi:DNA-binding NtrC family response regulator
LKLTHHIGSAAAGIDILGAAKPFFQKSKEKRRIETLPVKILEAMYRYDWPGNIRELENVLQRYTTLGRIDFIELSEAQSKEMVDVVSEAQNEGKGLRDVLEKFEKQYLVQILDQNRWHRGKTSEALKLPSKTLYRKMKKYQLL